MSERILSAKDVPPLAPDVPTDETNIRGLYAFDESIVTSVRRHARRQKITNAMPPALRQNHAMNSSPRAVVAKSLMIAFAVGAGLTIWAHRETLADAAVKAEKDYIAARIATQNAYRTYFGPK